jgi:hypothetical protein
MSWYATNEKYGYTWDEYTSIRVTEAKPYTKILRINKCDPSCPNFKRSYSSHYRSMGLITFPPYSCRLMRDYIHITGSGSVFPNDCPLKVMD